jgi:glycosyltransferase involved in cell wall biosynthesis
MSSQSLVSVITPFYNGEKFIQETIQSVLAQTYTNWELLLIDDNSADGSTEIALRYAEKYPDKVRYLEHENHQNKGQSASRNLGIREARGEYIALLDHDDVWLPKKLERQVEIMDSLPQVGMIYGATQYWYSWTGKLEDKHRDNIPELAVKTETLVPPPKLLLDAYPLGAGNAPCTGSLMMRREMLARTGGFEEFFRGEYCLYEDQAFLVKVYLNEFVYVSGECLDKYRLHPDSAMATALEAGRYHSTRLFFWKWFEKYLTEQEVQDQEIWLALKNAYWPYRHPVLYKHPRLYRLLVRARQLVVPRKSLVSMIYVQHLLRVWR